LSLSDDVNSDPHCRHTNADGTGIVGAGSTVVMLSSSDKVFYTWTNTDFCRDSLLR